MSPLLRCLAILAFGLCLPGTAGAAAGGAASAETVRTTVWSADAQDPWVAFNRPMHRFNERVDDVLLEPAAVFYRRVAPDPVERAILNFFDNLAAPIAIAGAALQADGDATAQATGRFVVNSTLGVGGLFDPATPLGLPPVEEDLAQAFERWGLDDTPYLVLPFLGPMTVSQAPDRVLRAFAPQWLLGEFWHPGMRVVDVVSWRASVMAASGLVESGALDSYVFTRDSYLQRRRYLRFDGTPPDQEWDTFLDDF